MENKEEILSALKTIQKVCKEHTNCDTCPLSIDGCCGVGDADPVEWKIRTTEIWKAFDHQEQLCQELDLMCK